LARYIRLYKTPETEDSVTMGFSSGIGAAAYDENLHTWLRRQGYKVTEESLAYRASHRYLENPTNRVIGKNVVVLGLPFLCTGTSPRAFSDALSTCLYGS
jgi:hypothetical protein